MIELRFDNGDRPFCPIRGVACDPLCPWLMYSEGGDLACAVTLLPMTDTFDVRFMHGYQRGSWN